MSMKGALSMTSPQEKTAIAEKSLRRRIYHLLESDSDLSGSHPITRAIAAIVLVNLVAVCLESVPQLASRWRLLFIAIELASWALLSLEYATPRPVPGPTTALVA
jgi:hypothetical protein